MKTNNGYWTKPEKGVYKATNNRHGTIIRFQSVDFKYCPCCGEKLKHASPTDTNSDLLCTNCTGGFIVKRNTCTCQAPLIRDDGTAEYCGDCGLNFE